MRQLKNSALFFSVFFLCPFFLFPMSKSSECDEITGAIEWYGNEPLAFLGVTTDSGEVFTLKTAGGSSFTLEDIAKLKGRRILFRGKKVSDALSSPETLKDGIFVVEEFQEAK